ncbi:MAG: acetate--CoA ligase family protein, partial [Alphaproteobacteria bacterium]|nr:acetate--CoA ligase family protein [Alphaproteobacteria bacterium]
VSNFPPNDRVGLLTVSGGVGVLMADDAQSRGLDVAPLPEAAQAEIREMVPFAGTRNPIDATGQVVNDATLLSRVTGIVTEQADYGSFICFHGAAGRNPERSAAMQREWGERRRQFPDRVFAAAGFATDEFAGALEAAGVPVFLEPTHAVRAVAALSRFGAYFAEGRSRPEPPAAPPALPEGPLHEVQVLELLQGAGVPTVAAQLCPDADAAARAAEDLGFPVALKVVSPDIPHKTEVGGVALNLADAAAVRAAFTSIMEQAAARMPAAAIAGCLVAPMVTDGVETILGVQRDPVFGPVVMFGLGGIFVEVLEDVTFRVAPFDEAEARRMIGEIRAHKVLEGVRGRPPADIDALAGALSRLSLFAAAHGEVIDSLDLNPFVVRPRGQGALALDAVLQLNSE